jgi:cystathionine beta-lyase
MRFATDPATLERVLGASGDVLPLWVAEPALPLAPAVVEATTRRAAAGWYGYESRPASLDEAVVAWHRQRHGWDLAPLLRQVSPSVATSLGVLLEALCAPGDGVLLQPPVFTDFKPLVRAGGLRPVTAPLRLAGDRYVMDLEALAARAAAPDVRVLVLCSPHNPVGRVWTHEELAALARICAENDVVVLADELHADVVLPGHTFVPFAVAGAGTGVRWAAMHGPLKTFGLAGMADTLLVTDDEELHRAFARRSDQLHLTRNHVVELAAMEAAYRRGGPWLDTLLADTARRAERLAAALPDPLRLLPLEGTYLGWLDLRALDLDVHELTRWLVDRARIAVSPGHWFGREGAGFARLTLAVEDDVLDEAARRLTAAVEADR